MHRDEWRIFTAQVESADDIGEVGLDFSSGADRATQERDFARVLSALRGRPRLITVHSRRAVRHVLKHFADAGLRGGFFIGFRGEGWPLAHAWPSRIRTMDLMLNQSSMRSNQLS